MKNDNLGIQNSIKKKKKKSKLCLDHLNCYDSLWCKWNVHRS